MPDHEQTPHTIEIIEQADIQAPPIEPGGSIIILQRHGAYDRNRDSASSGSLLTEATPAMRNHDEAFFNAILDQENADGAATMMLFVSSDTRYGNGGYRSLETGQVAQEAAAAALTAAGIDPATHIINLHPDFRTNTASTSQHIRPMTGLREPQIFDGSTDYIEHLQAKYGTGPDGRGLSIEAFAAHEADQEAEARELYGAEGVLDIIKRTRHSLRVLYEYARRFHASYPNHRLVIWATSHYDTISPLVKDATGTPLTEHVAVDYAGGVVIEIPPQSETAILTTRQLHAALPLGKRAVKEHRA